MFVVLFCFYILDHEAVCETFVFVFCAGYSSTGAASGRYQLGEEEDVSPSTGVSISRNSYKRREVKGIIGIVLIGV